jgi:hypothetical protein
MAFFGKVYEKVNSTALRRRAEGYICENAEPVTALGRMRG